MQSSEKSGKEGGGQQKNQDYEIPKSVCLFERQSDGGKTERGQRERVPASGSQLNGLTAGTGLS